MTGRRPLVLAVLGWLAIVVVGSTMVWTVVAHAGRNVAETGDGSLEAAASSGPSTGLGLPATASASSEQPTRSAQPSATADPTRPPGGPGETDGATDPGQGTASASTGGHPSSGPSHDPEKTPGGDSTLTTPPPDQPHRGTWQGQAGTVVASCTGTKISLVAAQPNTGWRVEVGDRGPEKLEVHFELSEEDDDRHDDRLASRALGTEAEVQARCVGGSPSFSLND